MNYNFKDYKIGSVMMTEDEIRFFKSYLDNSKVILEYGCGGSTLEYSKLVKKYISIENEKEWYDSVNEEMIARGSDNISTYLESPISSSDGELEKNAESLLSSRYNQGQNSGEPPSWNADSSSYNHMDLRDGHEWHTLINYVNKPLELIDEYGKFDIVLVDGVAREFCTYRAKDLIKDDGLIFIHDFKRTQYYGVLNFYEIVKQVDTLALLRLK